MRVEPLDLDGIVQQVFADFRRVRQERGNLCVLKLLAGLFSGSRLEPAVRFAAAHPEAERLTSRFLREERLEVSGTVRVPDPVIGRLGLLVQKAGTSRVASAPGGLPTTGLPGLARVADRVASLLEQILIAVKSPWERTGVGSGLRDPPDVTIR